MYSGTPYRHITLNVQNVGHLPFPSNILPGISSEIKTCIYYSLTRDCRHFSDTHISRTYICMYSCD